MTFDMNTLRLPVDARCRSVDALDALLVEEAVRPEGETRGVDLAHEIGFRQRRPLIGRATFIADQSDTAAEAVLPQEMRKIETGMAGTDNHNRRHKRQAPEETPFAPLEGRQRS